MRRILASALLFFSALGCSIAARADLLVEPYLGYNLLASAVTFGAGAGGSLDGQVIKLSDTGVGYGLRVGYAQSLFFVAVDYSMSSISSSVSEKPAAVTVTPTPSTGTSIGATVGFDLPLFRPYVGYILDDQVKSDTGTSFGTGFKAGAGFSVLPFIRLNVEYVTRTWTKSKSSDGTEVSFGDSALYKSVSDSGFFVNVSAPFSF